MSVVVRVGTAIQTVLDFSVTILFYPAFFTHLLELLDFRRLLSLLIVTWRRGNGIHRGKVLEGAEANPHHGSAVMWEQGQNLL